MKLYFRQRIFSWFDSYDITDESGSLFCTVKGQLSWGHCLKLFDPQKNEIGTVKERVLTLLPKFELYLHDQYVGCISKELTLFRPKYDIDCNGWHVEGDMMQWDYTIYSSDGRTVARISKNIFKLTDSYVIDVSDPKDAVCALMLVLAIDAEKCSRKD